MTGALHHTVADLVDSIRPDAGEIFDHLHAHPEVSWREHETTRYLAERFSREGLKVCTFGENPGLTTELGSGDPLIGIRADLDALWQEVDGRFQANHSCGHDAHMSVVSGVLLTLMRMKNLPKGRIRFIFQPAEEKGNGALKMIEWGALEGISHLFGLHLRPIQELPRGKASLAIMHGSGCFIEGQIIGEDAHGARPHLGTNAIEVASSLIQGIHGLHFDPRVPSSVKMTRLQAGGDSHNIIPGRASFALDLRAQTNEVMDEVLEGVDRVRRSVAEQFGVSIETKLLSRIVAARACPEAEALLGAAITEVLGAQNCHPPLVTPGGEDFHYYTHQLPELKATMLGLGCNLSPGLHHPLMTFDREAIFDGINILTRALLITLERLQVKTA